jgi:ELWxxDGT repeat protein
LLFDVNPGPASAGSNGQLELFGCPLGLFFAANSGNGSVLPWRSDGTAAGTVAMTPDFTLAYDAGEFAATAQRVFFAAENTAFGRELWMTTGPTTYGLVKDIAPILTVGSDPVGICAIGNRVLFAAHHQDHGRELWISDGTSAGTVLVEDLNPGPANGVVVPAATVSGPRYVITAVPGQPYGYCAAFEPATGIELYRSDGTAAGTVRLGDVAIGPAGSRPSAPVRCGTSWVLGADGGAIGTELFKIISPATWLQYGRGCRGGLGLVPQMAGDGAPQFGNQSFAAAITDARPATAGALLLAASPFSLPLGGGCTLLADVLGAYVSLPFATNARGDGSVRLPIPALVGLVGSSLHAQAVLADAGGAFAGIAALTGGLQMLIAR